VGRDHGKEKSVAKGPFGAGTFRYGNALPLPFQQLFGPYGGCEKQTVSRSPRNNRNGRGYLEAPPPPAVKGIGSPEREPGLIYHQLRRDLRPWERKSQQEVAVSARCRVSTLRNRIAACNKLTYEPA